MTQLARTSPPVPTAVATEPLSQGDYEAIKAYLSTRRNGQMYLLIVRLLRNTGLRLSEVMRLTVNQVTWDGPNTFLWIYRGKRKKAAWERVAIHPELGAELRAYMSFKGQRAGVILPIKNRAIQLKFLEAAYEALGRSAHLHQLRHLFVTTLIDGGVPVGVASKLVGHANEQTTLAWYYDLTADKRADIARRMPV